MTTRQRKKLVNWMRKNGVLELEEDGFKIKLDPLYSKQSNKKATKINENPDTDPIPTTEDPNVKMPNDGDLLFWSTGFFEDLNEGRKGPAVNEDKSNGN